MLHVYDDSRIVYVITAAGVYDFRQLQLGSAAGSSPVWALLADRLLLLVLPASCNYYIQCST